MRWIPIGNEDEVEKVIKFHETLKLLRDELMGNEARTAFTKRGTRNAAINEYAVLSLYVELYQTFIPRPYSVVFKKS